MKNADIVKLAETLAGTDMLKRWKASRQLDELLAGREDLSAAVPILSGRVLQIDPKVQSTILAILARGMKRSYFVEMINTVTSALAAKDRDERRRAAAILLAWAERKTTAPQEVYLALAHALRHKDNMLRKRVAANFWNRAAHAPDFAALVPILLATYSGDDELNRWVDKTLESAAERNLDIRAALSALTRRLKSPRSTAALTALIAYHVHQNHADKALALFREHGGGSYVCQEIGHRVHPSPPAAGVAILCLGLEHADLQCRHNAALGLQRYAEAGLDIRDALPALEAALADSAVFRLARSKVGEAAARALVAAAKQKRLRKRVVDILGRAVKSGGEVARAHATEALAPLQSI
jgi:hypothetical protein